MKPAIGRVSEFECADFFADYKPTSSEALNDSCAELNANLANSLQCKKLPETGKHSPNLGSYNQLNDPVPMLFSSDSPNVGHEPENNSGNGWS